jgi:hypothetical protein
MCQAAATQVQRNLSGGTSTLWGQVQETNGENKGVLMELYQVRSFRGVELS